METFKDELLSGENAALMKRVSKQNRNLKARFDEQVISKQNMQTSLKEIYRPITDNTTNEISKQITKTDTLFQQLLSDLQGKHDRTSRLLLDMIRGLARTNEEVKRQGLDIVSSIAKQPLLPELINELNNHPTLVKKIMQPGSIQNLNEEDRKALALLSHLNDNDLKTLINYYVLRDKLEPSEAQAVEPLTYENVRFEEKP